MNVTSPTEELVLRVWDQDMTTSDAVGFAKIKMSSLIINCGIEDWFTVMFDNKPAGQVFISTTFAPKGGDKYQALREIMLAQGCEDIDPETEAEAYARAEKEVTSFIKARDKYKKTR